MRSSRLESCFVYSHLGLVGCNIVLMKRFLTLLLILPLLFSWSCEEDTAGPEAVITFEKDIGHGKLAVKQTKDGGYIVAGGNSDAWLLKTDKYGHQQWVKHYGGAGLDQGQGLCQTSDMGILVAGYTSFLIHSGGTPVNFYLLPQKLNKTIYVGTMTLTFLIINVIK